MKEDEGAKDDRCKAIYWKLPAIKNSAKTNNNIINSTISNSSNMYPDNSMIIPALPSPNCLQ